MLLCESLRGDLDGRPRRPDVAGKSGSDQFHGLPVRHARGGCSERASFEWVQRQLPRRSDSFAQPARADSSAQLLTTVVGGNVARSRCDLERTGIYSRGKRLGDIDAPSASN